MSGQIFPGMFRKIVTQRPEDTLPCFHVSGKLHANVDENGFTIAKVKVPGRQDLVSIVGNLMAPMPGETIKMQGEWTNCPKFGEQFKIIFYEPYEGQYSSFSIDGNKKRMPFLSCRYGRDSGLRLSGGLDPGPFPHHHQRRAG